MWHEGMIKIDELHYVFYVKSYDKLSAFGIKHGKISKLEIWVGQVLSVQYDRGWISKPVSKIETAIFNMLMEMYN